MPYAQVLEERVNNGLVADYVYGLDLISQQRGSEKSFYLVDGLGSTRGLTNGSGVVTDRYSYDAFGNLIGSGGNTENNYLFAGEQFDKSLGDYYLRQRYYDQQTGRFNRRDSYEGSRFEPISQHKYLYANANPVNFIDPTGWFSIVDISAVNSIINTVAGVEINLALNVNRGLDSWKVAQNNEVDRAVQIYLNTANGPIGHRNYYKNSLFPKTLAYIDFHNFFVFVFDSEVIPDLPFLGIYRTELPDRTNVIVRPFALTVPAPTVEIQRPTGAPYKVRYLRPGETL
ncbi:hypothetical protein NIES2119_31730 [[Phormidium ambiguum] IAM M-71]|uniref:RHS repeat-associated core domain-containing protein n=1 Tax=[Phormidium ambiguum] IAM M-71 TaxID=454136 RepID=A0A1U7I1M7_9CYAN|nr:RHS repeat-associated core domain-containing protein [Phormidium ambiguum]OKH29943.1 hypothetical protein NIES2119_31730 [Phormidium ambiguum IAM M-71]